MLVVGSISGDTKYLFLVPPLGVPTNRSHREVKSQCPDNKNGDIIYGSSPPYATSMWEQKKKQKN